MLELVSFQYSSLRSDIYRQIDKMEALVEQLRAIDIALDENMFIGILVEFIDFIQLPPVTAAIKTPSEDKLSWEGVIVRLIEECKSHKEGAENRDRLSSVSTKFGVFQKTDQKTKD